MRSDIEWSFGRVETGDDLEAWFVHCALRFLCVLEGHTDLINGRLNDKLHSYSMGRAYLISELRTLIFLQQHELYSAPVRTNFFFYRMHSHVVLVPARSTGQRRLRHVQLQ